MNEQEEEDAEVIDLGPDLRPTGRFGVSEGDPLGLREVASKTVDFSGAELANLVNEAVFQRKPTQNQRDEYCTFLLSMSSACMVAFKAHIAI